MTTATKPTISVQAGRMTVDTSAGPVRVFPFISRATQTANAQRVNRIVADLCSGFSGYWFDDASRLNREMAD